jgi:hypothetical protein
MERRVHDLRLIMSPFTYRRPKGTVCGQVCVPKTLSTVYNKTGTVRINVTSMRVRVTTVAVKKRYIFCVYVALVIQHAQRMRHIILPSVVCLFLPYFSILSHKRHDFRKTLLNIKCVF